MNENQTSFQIAGLNEEKSETILVCEFISLRVLFSGRGANKSRKSSMNSTTAISMRFGQFCSQSFC